MCVDELGGPLELNLYHPFCCVFDDDKAFPHPLLLDFYCFLCGAHFTNQVHLFVDVRARRAYPYFAFQLCSRVVVTYPIGGAMSQENRIRKANFSLECIVAH